jgi:hypothetical protein
MLQMGTWGGGDGENRHRRGGVQTVPPIFRIHLVVLNIMDEGGDKFCGNQIKDEARGIGDW